MTFTHKKLAVFCVAAALSTVASVQAAPVLGDGNINTPETVSLQTTNSWLEIDAAAFGRNLAAVKQMLGGKQKICAVLKADAYGHGVETLMPEIIKHQIPCVGITSNEEARVVRASGYTGVIARLRTTTLGEIQNGFQYNIEELFGNFEAAKQASEAAGKAGVTLKYHMSLNSGGMGRNGLALDTHVGKADALAITKLPNLQIVGIMTHYAVEDVEDVRKGLAQFDRESKWLIRNAKLDRSKLTLHTANSFTTVAVPEARYDMVRPGGLLYGEPAAGKQLEVVMAFKSRVASVNLYPKGATIGYDRTFTLKRDSRVANLPLGYSDGYRRAFTNKGHVLINGHRVPVVGKVSMNTTMVDVTDFPDIKEGDEVVLFGKQGNEEITQAEIEEITDVLFADVYTVWGNSNPKILKP
ncbi:alanine racemase [Wielerella bovis]|uniref:alanine racemase n=1 Tax=Wielerella bovis TaxID=2917790 RepID=UPI0020198FCB|nr:alanine racemase [Wielerella bovis]MCG7656332.1 alanine racemase [Wielerella bovis]MCG7658557.1 alanine racemase [Wielerella bovis]